MKKKWFVNIDKKQICEEMIRIAYALKSVLNEVMQICKPKLYVLLNSFCK